MFVTGLKYIMAIMAVASNKEKVIMDKMKLYLKSKATFGPDE